MPNVREIFKEREKKIHEEWKCKGNIDLRVNALIGNIEERHLKVGGTEIKSATFERFHRGSRSEVPLCSQPSTSPF